MSENHSGPQIYPLSKRVRAHLNDRFILDTTDAVLYRQPGRPPVYYFPHVAFGDDVLVAAGHQRSDSRGEADVYHLEAGDERIEDAAWSYTSTEADVPDLTDLVGVDWNAPDHWFEDGEPVLVHPRDPFTRIEVHLSDAPVRVELDGEVIAESDRARLLYETGLPVRYYVPLIDTRLDLLRPSDSETYCPYKGRAQYFDVQIGDTRHGDVLWYYQFPRDEAIEIARHVAFYPQKVDALRVNGTDVADSN